MGALTSVLLTVGRILLSALAGPFPPLAPSHPCSTLSPEAKEVGRYLNYQAIVPLPQLFVHSHSLVSAPSGTPAFRCPVWSRVDPRAQPRRKRKIVPRGWFETNFTGNSNSGFLQEGYKHHRECERKKHVVAADFKDFTERSSVATIRKFQYI